MAGDRTAFACFCKANLQCADTRARGIGDLFYRDDVSGVSVNEFNCRPDVPRRGA